MGTSPSAGQAGFCVDPWLCAHVCSLFASAAMQSDFSPSVLTSKPQSCLGELTRGVPAASQRCGMGGAGVYLLGDQRTRCDLGWVQVLSQSLLFPRAVWMSEVTAIWSQCRGVRVDGGRNHTSAHPQPFPGPSPFWQVISPCQGLAFGGTIWLNTICLLHHNTDSRHCWPFRMSGKEKGCAG